MVAAMKVLQVILAFAILICLHELGHFTFAKLFHIRVEKFFLFFDLGGVHLFSTKKSRWFTRLCPRAAEWETEFGIGWMPLGGYCKISGMVDESMDLDTLKQEVKPWELRAHPAWQKLFVMAGGVLYNFIFAILAYSLIMGIWGEAYIPNQGSHIYVNKLSYEMGFRTGDQVLKYDDYVPEDFGELQIDLARRNVHKATVLRDADTVEFYIDQAMIGEVLSTPAMFDLALPFKIESVMEGSANQDLLKDDSIIALDGNPVRFVQDAHKILASIAGGSAVATVVRDADTLSVPVMVDSVGRLGVQLQLPEIKSWKYKGLSCLAAGFSKTGEMISGYLKDLKLLVKPSTGAYKSVGSFIAIGQVFPSAWDWYQFLSIVALLSIMLGVLNLLPIPGLDGGHILFTIYEMVTGHKPDDRFMTIAQMIGMVLLIGLMILAFGNDIGRLMN